MPATFEIVIDEEHFALGIGSGRLARKVFLRHSWQGGQPALLAEIKDLRSQAPTVLGEAGILGLHPCQICAKWMPPCGREEMMVGEIDADDTDASGSHVHGESDGDIGRIPGKG